MSSTSLFCLKLGYKIFFTICLLHFLSCEKQASPHSPPTHKNELHVNFTQSPLSIDPRKHTDPYSSCLAFMLYEGLTHLEPNGKISLALAKDIHISEDQKTYTFFLKQSYWSDGRPLTAFDFETSWKRVLSPEFNSHSAQFLYIILNAKKAKKGNIPIEKIGVKALDDYTLEVMLKKPTPHFLKLTAYCTFFPVRQDKSNCFNGPFQLVSWKHNDEIIAEKNPYFWEVDKVYLKKIHITLIQDEATAFHLFEKGKIDWIGGLISPLPLAPLSTMQKQQKLKTRRIAGTTFCTFNTKKFPFNNAKIRKAFAYAINRQSITKNVLPISDESSCSIVPSVFMQSNHPLLFRDHQIQLAQNYFNQGLEELGIGRFDFPNLAYSFFYSELQEKIALILQDQWEKVLGVRVKLQRLEFKTFLHKLHNKDFSFAQMSWIAQYHDPLNFLERFFKKTSYCNYSSWEHPYYTFLLQKSSSQVDKQKRLDLLIKAETFLEEEMPITPLHHFHALYLENPKLKNIAISPLGDVQFRHAYFLD